MKVTIKTKRKDFNKSKKIYTFQEIIREPGIYVPCDPDRHSGRIIIKAANVAKSRIYINLDNGRLESLYAPSWQNCSFYKTKETIKINIV